MRTRGGITGYFQYVTGILALSTIIKSQDVHTEKRTPTEGFLRGDVLFKDTVGRTDLPSGDLEKLMESIKTRLFTLPENTVVYPGHGPETTIGYEMANNPFIR